MGCKPVAVGQKDGVIKGTVINILFAAGMLLVVFLIVESVMLVMAAIGYIAEGAWTWVFGSNVGDTGNDSGGRGWRP